MKDQMANDINFDTVVSVSRQFKFNKKVLIVISVGEILNVEENSKKKSVCKSQIQ